MGNEKKMESKGAEGGLKVELTNHESDLLKEDSTERLVSSLAEALRQSLGSHLAKLWQQGKLAVTSALGRAEFQNMACTVYTICQPGLTEKL